MASRIHRAAQPALLYLVPFTLLPLLTMAYLKVGHQADPLLSFRGVVARVDACVVSRATCGVCGPSLSTPSPAALAFWRYDAPRDKRTSVGRTVDPLPFRRGKERGRAHSEAVSSSLVHAFPPVKTLQKDSGVWITRPQHASSLGSAHLHFLFIIPHPVCAVFAPPSSSHLPFFPLPLSRC